MKKVKKWLKVVFCMLFMIGMVLPFTSKDIKAASIDSVSVVEAASDHITIRFSCSADVRLARVQAKSIQTGKITITDYTTGLNNVTHTFYTNTMTNPGRTFELFIYGYTSLSGDNETLHRVTYYADPGYVTLPENPVRSSIDVLPSTIIGRKTISGWASAEANNPVTKVYCYINGVAYTCSRTTRADVAQAYPTYQTTNQGFSMYISPMYVNHGKNTLRVVAVQKDGKQTDLYNGDLHAVKMNPDLFDASWYYGNYAGSDSSVASIGEDAAKLTEHYYNIGISKGYKPNICFDPVWYQSKRSELAGFTYEECYEHYVNWCLNGTELSETSCFLNLTYYKNNNKDLQQLKYNGYQLTEHYLKYGSRKEGRQGSANAQSKAFAKLYNAENYAALNTDLKKELGDGKTVESADRLWNHFMIQILAGNEERKTNNAFDFAFYKSKYGYKTSYDAFWGYIDKGYSANHVTIEVKVTDISLGTTDVTLTEGENTTLKYTIAPTNATDKTVKWSTSDAKIATVDANGKITAVGVGTTTITCKSADGKVTAKCAVTVNAIPEPEDVLVSMITLDKTSLSLEKGKESTFSYVVSPSDATNKNVTWSSENPEIAQVDENGKVTAIGAGTTTIICKSVDGNTSSNCSVTVIDKESLQSALDSVLEINDENKDKYTPDSWKEYEDAYQKAEDIIKDENATQEEIDAALKDLEDAKDNLKNKVDKTVLDAAIKYAVPINDENKEKYTTGSWTAYEAAYNNALSVLEDDNATQAVVDAVMTDLMEAQYDLIERADFSDLQAEVDAVLSEADKEKYTTESWDAYQKALQDAKKVLEDPDTAQDEVDASLKALKDAKENLELSVTDIVLGASNLIMIEGTEEVLKYTIIPADAADKTVKWSTDNAKVAAVDENGKVTAVGVGTTTITCTSADGRISVECQIVVNAIPKPEDILVSKVELDKESISLKKGNDAVISYTVAPENATNKNVNWLSENPEVAQVDENGKVTAIGAGTTVITCKSVDGNASATCSVTVIDKEGLQSVIDSLPAIEDEDKDKYTSESWKEYEDAYHKAEDVLKDEDATQEEIDAALKDLENAKNNLTEKADKSLLDTVIKYAIPINDENKEKYTKDSWNAYEDAYNRALEVFENENATQADVDEALTALMEAQHNLVEKEQLPDVDLPYEDVTEADWFYEAVYYTFARGMMTGMDTTHFGPYASLSRAQFALILYRIEDTPSYETEKVFKDISGDEWYGDAVLWAAENNIVTGYMDGNFGPADMITREQMAVMMYRYAKYLGEDVSNTVEFDGFRDASSVSAFALDAMQWAVGEGIITGKDNGKMLDPQGNTARCEAAVIIQRFME